MEYLSLMGNLASSIAFRSSSGDEQDAGGEKRPIRWARDDSRSRVLHGNLKMGVSVSCRAGVSPTDDMHFITGDSDDIGSWVVANDITHYKSLKALVSAPRILR